MGCDRFGQDRYSADARPSECALQGRGHSVVAKAEGAYPGKPPPPEQLAEIRAVLEAAGIEFTDGGVKLKRIGRQGGMEGGGSRSPPRSTMHPSLSGRD